MTTVGIYPWDVSQLASHSAIESTSTTQSKILWVSVSTNLTNVMTPSVSAPPLSTAPYLNTSTALSSAAAAPSSCDSVPPGFIIDFDDLPAFSTGPEDTDIPPIFNPYHKLYFQKYFGYVPPPTDPFPPISGRQLAVYRESGLNIAGPADADFELTGEIGAGPRASNNAYWIDAYSAYLGCTNPGPESCTITINGYVDGATVSHMTQTVNQPPCPGLKNCSLALVAFEDGFRGLTGFQIIATVASKPVDWYMDDFSLGWSNNTCTAQLERSSSR